MVDKHSEIVGRCRKLGLQCDSMPLDAISSGLAALSSFPMYMVANVHAWTTDTQFLVPIFDLPGSEHIREAFELGRQEGGLGIDKQHRRVLGALVSNPKPSDLIIYEYALETLKMTLELLPLELAGNVRTAIARMVVAVAKASGEGLGGSGPKVNVHEEYCINFIDETLSLSSLESAAAILEEVVNPSYGERD